MCKYVVVVWVSHVSISQLLQKYFVEELSRENIEHLPKSITNEYSIKER